MAYRGYMGSDGIIRYSHSNSAISATVYNIDAGAEENITIEDNAKYIITNARIVNITLPTGGYNCSFVITMGESCSISLPVEVTCAPDNIVNAAAGEMWEISADYSGGKHAWVVKNWGVIT